MPTYAYRCRECASEFDVQRPMSQSTEPALCPAGHTDTVKLLSTVSLAASAAQGGGGAATGGCCGGACGCSG